jgi:arylsulfatase A-like enzyme/Flp pilus assembly protein TadD
LSAVGGWRYARASAPVSGPIILLTVDSLRADRLPAYGYRGVRTPAIDALAADGVVFERAYAHVPQTLPAHASILTGRLPFETGVRDNIGFTVGRNERLLAEMLADRGYATAGVVSSYVLREDTGIAQGFAFYDGVTRDDAEDDPRAGLARDGAESVAVAERWLDSAGTERAFLFLHLYEPHSPHAPPARFAAYAPYDGEVAYADEIVGRFVKYLKAHQLYDQSTIIFLGDHGEGLGSGGELEHGLLVDEAALRVPLIIKPAAGEGAGRRVDDVVQHVDIVPTVLDLAKAPVSDNLSGRSLKPLIEGADMPPGRVVYSESLFGSYRFGWSALTSVTDGRYRLTSAPHAVLYDVAGDPAGLTNVIASRPSERQRLTAALDRFARAQTVHTPLPVAAGDLLHLSALGYVGVRAAATAGEPPIEQKDAVTIVEAFRSATRFVVDGQWARATEQLQSVLRQYPDMGPAWELLGHVALNAGRLDRAVDAYGRAAALLPDQAGPHVGAALALVRLRRFDEARRQARLAERLEPALPVSAYVEGRQSSEAGRHEDALALFERAISGLGGARAPFHDLHLSMANALIRLERPSEAEYHLLEELRLSPHNLRARSALATLYHQGGRTDEAADVLADLVRVTGTPDAHTLATRLRTAFGYPEPDGDAETARAQARVPRTPGSAAGQ